MEPRIHHIVEYIKKHTAEYKPAVIDNMLLQHNYKQPEIDEARGIIADGGTTDSFFNQNKFGKPQKTRAPLGIISIGFSIIPIIGFIIAYNNSKTINQQAIPGRELAFFAMILNVIITFFILVMVVRLILEFTLLE